MPLFTLPLAPTASTPQSRVHFSSLPLRKRKRAPSPASSDDDAKSLHPSEAASTNPLSLTPAEVVQYRLAGLELHEESPGKHVKNWPHRGLPALPNGGAKTGTRGQKKGKGKGKAREIDSDDNDDGQMGGYNSRGDWEEEGAKKSAQRGPRLRIQHLSVLITILQRCLLEGDIPRASRAWAMLIRARVGGKAIDIRGSGYWAIGAELLVRGQEQRIQRRGSGADKDDDDDNEKQEEEEPWKGRRRWGSVEGLEKANEYYKRLILQYPYIRQFHGNVSALDFWPVMVGCEIYGIQWERKEGLRRVAWEEENEDETAGSQSDEDVSDVDNSDHDGNPFAAEVRQNERRRQRRAEKRWQERDEIRHAALVAYEKIAARLDEVMPTPPYSDSHALLRLRGMLALCIGDLSLPALPVDDKIGGEDDEDEYTLEGNLRLGIGGRDTERRLLHRQRLAEHNRGKKKQKEEQARARKLFDRIKREGGRVGEVKTSMDQNEDEGDDEADEFYD